MGRARHLIHACDAVGWYAAHLAVQARHRLRVDVRVHDDATNAEVLDVLEATAATLALVARAAPPDARAYHSAGMADVVGFVAMGCDEVLVHGWDACRGLGLGLVAPPDLAGRVLERLFPWAPRGVAPWPALLWANGRVDLPAVARGPGRTGYGTAHRSTSGTGRSRDGTVRPPNASGGTPRSGAGGRRRDDCARRSSSGRRGCGL